MYPPELEEASEKEAKEFEELCEEVKAHQENFFYSQDDLAARSPEELQLHRFIRQRLWLESEIERVKENTARILRRLEGRLKAQDYVYGQEARNIVQEMLKGKKEKSILTPFGRAGFRTVPAQLEIVEEQLIFDAVHACKLPSLFVRTKEEIDKRELKAWFAMHGELPPGTELLEKTEKFYVS